MSQYIIIGGDGKEYGPVTVEEVREWVQAGRANGETRIKPEGAEDWTRVQDLPEFGKDLGGDSTAEPTAPPPYSADPQGGGGLDPALPSDLLTRDHGVWSAGCFERGWQIFCNHLGGSIGVFTLFLAIFFIVVLFSIIPFIGLIFSLATMIAQPVLMGGLFYYFIKLNRGERAEVGDLFSGFSRNFAGLFLVNLIQSLIIIATMIPGLILVFISIGGPILEAIRNKTEPDIDGAIVLLVIAGFFLMILPSIYLGTCWAYSLPLAADRRMGFWQAMQTSRKVVNKHWFQLFFFFIVVSVIGQLGIILCGVGILFTLPLAFCIHMAAYEHLFGVRGAPQTLASSTPPAPPQI